jgi:hypothetical protein
MNYTQIPSLSQWQKDSSVALAVRKTDVVLARIDTLLELYTAAAGDDAKRLIFLSDLFFTLDYWLKIFRTNPLMERGRQPAIQAFYERAAYALCDAFKCTINGLPRELELMWGRELSLCGVHTDLVKDQADYISRAEAAKFRLRFRDGKAYQLPWYQPSAWSGPVLAESRHAHEPNAFLRTALKPGALPNDHYGFFVLTMGRDLYMARHQAGGQGHKGFYHSSYVGGDPIVCSGTMLIEKGVIKRIRFDSGHYQPQANNYRALVMALRMWGVSLANVAFEDFNAHLLGTDLTKAVQDPRIGTVDYVLSQTDTMLKLVANRNTNLDTNQVAQGMRPPANPNANVRGPNPRDWWGNRPRQPEVVPPGAQKM